MKRLKIFHPQSSVCESADLGRWFSQSPDPPGSCSAATHPLLHTPAVHRYSGSPFTSRMLWMHRQNRFCPSGWGVGGGYHTHTHAQLVNTHMHTHTHNQQTLVCARACTHTHTHTEFIHKKSLNPISSVSFLIVFRFLLLSFFFSSLLKRHFLFHDDDYSRTTVVLQVSSPACLSSPLARGHCYFFLRSSVQRGQNHLPLGFIFSPTQAKWNHSMGHWNSDAYQ